MCCLLRMGPPLDIGEETSVKGDRPRKIAGGEGGIRTREKLAPLHAFQACPFGRSGTSPAWRGIPAHRTRKRRATGNLKTEIL